MIAELLIGNRQATLSRPIYRNPSGIAQGAALSGPLPLNSSLAGACFILGITVVENLDIPTNPTPSKHSRWFDFRLAAALILLVTAIWFSWKTVDGLAVRRLIRTDLAEIENARYGILSADQWRTIIGPMLNAQIDQLDLKGQSKSLRPLVQRSLYALLDNIEMRDKPSLGMPGGGNRCS